MMTATRLTAVMRVLPNAHWYVPDLLLALPMGCDKHLRGALKLMEEGGILEAGWEHRGGRSGRRRYYKWTGKVAA